MYIYIYTYCRSKNILALISFIPQVNIIVVWSSSTTTTNQTQPVRFFSRLDLDVALAGHLAESAHGTPTLSSNQIRLHNKT